MEKRSVDDAPSLEFGWGQSEKFGQLRPSGQPFIDTVGVLCAAFYDAEGRESTNVVSGQAQTFGDGYYV
jgi:hypothetical protein